MAGQHLFTPDQPSIHPSNSEHLLCEGTLIGPGNTAVITHRIGGLLMKLKERLLFWLPSLQLDLQELMGVHQAEKERWFKVGKKGVNKWE